VTALRQEFSGRGAAVFVVSFAEPEKLIRYRDLHRWPFAILADPQRHAYRAFGLERLSWRRLLSLSTLKLYSRLLRAGMKRQYYGREDIFQSGGDFLIDCAGDILFAHRSADPADRPSAQAIIQQIDALREVGKAR
jgi:peroxiredoxin